MAKTIKENILYAFEKFKAYMDSIGYRIISYQTSADQAVPAATYIKNNTPDEIVYDPVFYCENIVTDTAGIVYNGTIYGSTDARDIKWANSSNTMASLNDEIRTLESHRSTAETPSETTIKTGWICRKRGHNVYMYMWGVTYTDLKSVTKFTHPTTKLSIPVTWKWNNRFTSGWIEVPATSGEIAAYYYYDNEAYKTPYDTAQIYTTFSFDID